MIVNHALSIFARLRTLTILRLTSILSASVALPYEAVWAQGDPNSIQSALHAVGDLKFKDRLYASGGPKVLAVNNGLNITKVIIEGNHSISEHNILSRMQTREGRTFDADTFNLDIAELWRSEFFKDIRASLIPDKVNGTTQVKIVVTENRVIRNITFHGNRAFTDKDLLKYCGFKVGDPIGSHIVLAAKVRLEDYYQSEGFSQAIVEIVQGEKPDDTEVFFSISEGELERVEQIRFVGNVVFSTDLLKTKIGSRDGNRYLPKLTKYAKNKASSQQIHSDVVALTEYYRSLGYFDARIDRVVEYDDSGKWINLTFVVFEGQPYQVRNVKLEGNQYYPSEKLQPYLEVKGASEYRQNWKASDEVFLRDAYGAVGFIFCNVTARLELEPDTHVVDIVYEIDEGDIYRCSDINIHIEGDESYTKEHVPMNLMGNLRPNAIIDGRELNGAKRRLAHSTIFESNPANGMTPRIAVHPYDDQDDRE
jgi:outer membrane protein insertion porin family